MTFAVLTDVPNEADVTDVKKDTSHIEKQYIVHVLR